MDFTDHFLNQGWIYLKNVDPRSRKKIEGTWSAETIAFEEAIGLVREEHDSCNMLIFSFESGFILAGKYPFSDLEAV